MGLCCEYLHLTLPLCVGLCGENADRYRLFFERRFLLQCYQMLRPPKDETKKKI